MYITVAGRSNALSGFIDATILSPVIICPPYSSSFNGSDLYSSIHMSSGICPMIVLDPENACLAAAKILALNDERIATIIHHIQKMNQQIFYVTDIDIHTRSYYSIIESIQNNTLSKANLDGINTESLSNGKVCDCFELENKVYDCSESGNKVMLITTDYMVGFDRKLCTVPFKGQVLNLISAWWFHHTKHIIPNYVLTVPKTNVMIVHKCIPFPIEFMIQGYITESTSISLWTNYEKGIRKYCGINLPEGLRKNQKLWENLITPIIKSDMNNELISPEDIIHHGFMTQEDWDYCSTKAKELFEFGQKVVNEHGLILVDTKYEFGKDENGVIRLIDEIHTPDSSHYWISTTYENRFKAGENPDTIDNEFLYTWYKSHCDPYEDEVLPEVPIELIHELSRRYIKFYELITGEDFHFPVLTNTLS